MMTFDLPPVRLRLRPHLCPAAGEVVWGEAGATCPGCGVRPPLACTRDTALDVIAPARGLSIQFLAERRRP